MNGAARPYQVPDPRIRPDSFLTLLYKTLKAIEFDDRAWDKIYFARCNKRMKALLDNMDNDVQLAASCLVELKEKFEQEMEVDWTIETIIKYSFEWKAQRAHRTDRDCLRRFLGVYSEDERIGELKRPDVSSLLEKMKELPPPAEESY